MSKAEPDSQVRDFSLGEFQTGRKPAPRPAGDTAFHPGQFEPLNLGQPEEDPRERAQRQAKQMVDEANAQVAQAKKDVERIRAQAYEEGYKQGQQEGHAASQARIEAAMSNLEAAATALARAKANVLAHMEREIVALVQAAVDGVFLSVDAMPAKLLRQVVGRAVAQIGESERLTIHCSAADAETLREFRPQLLDAIASLAQVDLNVRDDLRPGDCLVESPETMVDATLQTRRQAILAQLEQTLRQGPPLDLAGLADQPPAAPAADWAAAGDPGEDW